MRVLFASSLGGLGHLEPVVTVAEAAGRVGHEVLVIVPSSLVAAVKRTGLDFVVGDEPPSSFVDEVWARVRAGPPETVAGLIDRELFAERHAGHARRRSRRARLVAAGLDLGRRYASLGHRRDV